MEYAKDSAFIKDFIFRTKENINHVNHPYEVTQLINSLIGLLVLPKEKYYNNIKDTMIDHKLLNDIKKCIEINNSHKRCNLKYIVRRIRNSIAHFHIECKADKNTLEIDKIVFSDYDNGNNTNIPDFRISFTVELVKDFVDQFSDEVAKSIVGQ